MFTKRTIKPSEVVTSVDTASEALAVSIAEKAKVDMEYILYTDSYARLPGCCNSVPVGAEIPKGRYTGTYEKADDKKHRKTAEEAGTGGAATEKQVAVRRKLPVENGE